MKPCPYSGMSLIVGCLMSQVSGKASAMTSESSIAVPSIDTIAMAMALLPRRRVCLPAKAKPAVAPIAMANALPNPTEKDKPIDRLSSMTPAETKSPIPRCWRVCAATTLSLGEEASISSAVVVASVFAQKPMVV